MPVPNSSAARIESQEVPPARRHFVSLDPANHGNPETLQQMNARLAAERAAARAERAAASARAKNASGTKVIAPSFDLLAGIDQYNTDFTMEDKEESKPNTFKVPGTVYTTYRRVHSAFIEEAKKDKEKKAMESSELCTSAVYFWLKALMESTEAQGMVEAFRDVETTEGLDPFVETALQDMMEDCRLLVSDPFGSTPRQLCFRMHPGVDKYVSNCVTALRIERSSLVKPCLMMGLCGQRGCNHKNVEHFTKAYTDLVASCQRRARPR